MKKADMGYLETSARRTTSTGHALHWNQSNVLLQETIVFLQKMTPSSKQWFHSFYSNSAIHLASRQVDTISIPEDCDEIYSGGKVAPTEVETTATLPGTRLQSCHSDITAFWNSSCNLYDRFHT